jgi:hypothetical protein
MSHGGVIGGRGVLPPGRRRPRNTSNLADALVDVLTGTEMSVTEVAQAVQDAGYMTTSPNFRTIVNQTLIKDNRIKKISRGIYTAKGNAAGSRKRGRKKAAAAAEAAAA